MRNKTAKQLRRLVYGDKVTNPTGRKYYRHKGTGQIIADELRRTYQNTKRAIHGEHSSK